MDNQTYGAKVVSQKGNSPEQMVKVPKLLLSEMKVVIIPIQPGNGLGIGHFLKNT